MIDGEYSLRDRKRKYAFSEDECLFTVAVVIFLITVILDMSLINNNTRVTQIFRYVSYCIACFKFLRDAYDKTKLTKIFVGFGLLTLGFAVNRNQVMLLYTIIILASKNIADTLVMKVFLAVQTVMTFGIVSLSQMGILLDYVYISANRIRHFLGFDYTTMAPIFTIFIIAEFIYIKKGKIKLWEFLLGIGISTLFYKWTDTNYTFLLSVGMLTFFFLNGTWIGKGYITYTFRKLMVVSPWAFAAVSIWIQAAYKANNEVWKKLNDLVHLRLSLGHEAIEKYGFNLLGNKIDWVTSSYSNGCNPQGYNYVDSAYLQLILQQGIICFVLVLLVYSIIISLMIKNKKYYAAWIIVFLLAFNMTEPKLVHIIYNPFIMLGFSTLTEELKVVKKNLRFESSTEKQYVNS